MNPVPPHAPVEAGDLLRWAGVLLGLGSLALIALQARLLRRGVAVPLREKLLILAGLALMPVSTLTIAQAVTLEHMHTVEFCRSCHVMQPFVDSFAATEGVTLAALHVQNHRVDPKTACFTCHTQYSLFGPVKVKLRGMHHLLRYYTRRKGDPIRLYEPYPNANCLHCHGGARNFEEQAAHVPVMDQIASGEMSCLVCHSSIHPEIPPQ